MDGKRHAHRMKPVIAAFTALAAGSRLSRPSRPRIFSCAIVRHLLLFMRSPEITAAAIATRRCRRFEACARALMKPARCANAPATVPPEASDSDDSDGSLGGSVRVGPLQGV